MGLPQEASKLVIQTADFVGLTLSKGGGQS